MPDEFLTVHEVAAQLKLNQQTIRNWIDRRHVCGGATLGLWRRNPDRNFHGPQQYRL
jgi:hypothetical protein